MKVSTNCGVAPAGAFVALMLMACAAQAADDIFCNGFDAASACPGVPFMVVPNRAYAYANTPLSVYLSTSATATDITLDGPGGQTVSLVLSGQSGNRVDATIPAGTLDPGLWSVQATTLGSVAQSPQLLLISGTTGTLSLDRVTPAGASSQSLAHMHVLATDPPPAGQESFAAMPELFLQLHNTPDVIRIEDRDFVSAADIAISLPAGVAPGSYDLIAINADGATGVQPNAVTIFANAAPTIARSVPEVSPATTGQQVMLYGANFGATAPTASASCVDSLGNPVGLPSAIAGTPNANGTAVTVTFNFATLSNGDICILQLQTADGQYASYAYQPITSPSLNLGPVTPMSSALQTGRRGPVLLAGPVAPEGRRLYAIGGDNGSAAGAMSSVESAPIGAYGALGAFRDELSLPQPITLAGGVAVGDYLYVIGGNNGTGPVADAYRSRVLRDLRVPALQTVAALPAPAAGSGLASGLWRYRVAPLSSAADPDNPSGEGLPGAELSVDVPAVQNGVQITLTFDTSLPNIDNFAIYRSPSAGAEGFERLAVVPNVGTTTYTDTGGATISGTAPLPLGALGNWATLPSMATVREGAAVAIAPDPGDATKNYIYAIAGRSSPTLASTSYEYLTVTTAFDGTQSVASSWSSGISALSTARANLGAWVADSFSTSSIPSGTIYIYAGPGVSSAGTTGVNSVDAGSVAVGGDLGSWNPSPQDAPTPSWGYATAQADNRLYLIGGANGAPSSGVHVAFIGASPPLLLAGAWNNEGASLAHGVVYAGAAAADGFIYIAGGQTDSPSSADTIVQRIVK